MSFRNYDRNSVGVVQTVLSFLGFYVLDQDEIGVKLTFGNYSGKVSPGLGFIIPIIQNVRKTKSSIQTIDLPDQKIVLEGNIAVKLSGSVNFRVSDPEKAILGVNNYAYSLKQLSLTTISEVLGNKSIEDIRSSKNQIANEIEEIIATTASKWGLREVDIRLTDAEMDESLLRAMMRETEAIKEAMAVQIKAESDRKVSKIFAEAAQTLASSPGALTLRVLQTLSDMSNSKSTVVMPLPIEFFPGANISKPSFSSFKESKVFLEGDDTQVKCPHCDKKYVVNHLAKLVKLDESPEMPGIQLSCKFCNNTFTISI